MANVKVPLQMVPVWVVNNGRNYLKFTLSRGHFYQKLKYLQTETTEQGPFLGETGACQMAQNGPMLFLMVNITISKLDVCMFVREHKSIYFREINTLLLLSFNI